MYNYSELIYMNNKFDIDNEYMKRFYFTNNIESQLTKNQIFIYRKENKSMKRKDEQSLNIFSALKSITLLEGFKLIDINELQPSNIFCI